MTNGSLMKVESIAECSPWSILQYFWPALRDNRSWKPILIFFLSGCLRQVLLYWLSGLKFTKCLSELQTGNTLIRLLLKKQSDLGLHCLSRPFWQEISVCICRNFTEYGNVLKFRTLAIWQKTCLVLFGLILYVPVNSYGHVGTVSSPNHTFSSWASLT